MEFRADIKYRSVESAVQKHLTFGACCLLPDDAYFELKHAVAENFKIHPSEVLVVGSAKLGFSIAPPKRYKLFGDTSDIDVALVAPTLFDQVWSEVYRYKEGGAYWPEETSFCSYLLRGWIRPDKLPPSRSFPRCQEWWNYFTGLTQTQTYGPFKIRAALYRSWPFLESYQRRCVRECRELELT